MENLENNFDQISEDQQECSSEKTVNYYNENNSETAEFKLLKEAKTQLKRIMDLIPESYKIHIRNEERKEVKDRVVQMYATVQQMYGILKEVRSEREERNSITPNLLESIKEIKTNIQHSNKTSSQLSYAEVTRSNISTQQMGSQNNRDIINNSNEEGNSAVLIYPNSEQETNINMEGIVTKIKENIQPKQIKIKVKGIKKIRGNGVCIVVNNNEEGDRLKNAIKKIKEIDNKIKCRVAGKRQPKIILLNVPNSLPEEDIIEIMIRQNDIWRGLDEDNLIKDCRLTSIIKSKRSEGKSRHIIITVTPTIRNFLMKNKNIALQWYSIQVDDYIPIQRCFQCCGFGHWARDCKESQKCSHCSKQHRFSECKLTNTIPACTNCKRNNIGLPPDKKLATNHNAFDKICPLLKKLRKQLIGRIDYGP
ncbi:uncharacterized protein LOC111638375 [Centruroides sculpturatus]|uniref:uncharacterized protein LOC111633792 n=1 Tax=Centruroides sculpturatus TaxID=218467 RepID=UPI000C6DF555|nr:uncharacterized protein LOC111633792 [Centruroides sculpturatus]XP_023239844.1 uncharacterized protein LOC111638375 [Centruroides sculpturatus]